MQYVEFQKNRYEVKYLPSGIIKVKTKFELYLSMHAQSSR